MIRSITGCYKKYSLLVIFVIGSCLRFPARKDMDAIMMSKNNFCTGGIITGQKVGTYAITGAQTHGA